MSDVQPFREPPTLHQLIYASLVHTCVREKRDVTFQPDPGSNLVFRDAPFDYERVDAPCMLVVIERARNLSYDERDAIVEDAIFIDLYERGELNHFPLASVDFDFHPPHQRLRALPVPPEIRDILRGLHNGMLPTGEEIDFNLPRSFCNELSQIWATLDNWNKGGLQQAGIGFVQMNGSAEDICREFEQSAHKIVAALGQPLDLRGILEDSLNIVSSLIAQELGPYTGTVQWIVHRDMVPDLFLTPAQYIGRLQDFNKVLKLFPREYLEKHASAFAELKTAVVQLSLAQSHRGRARGEER